jgi:hypothetical protein
MKRAVLLVGVLALVAVAPGSAEEKGKGVPKKVQVFVKSSLVPGTGLASELKAGAKKITDIVVTSDGSKSDLSEITKGTGERPKVGGYFVQQITVYKGKAYKAHDVYTSVGLPKNAKLKEFAHQGTFTGKFDGKNHKVEFFEATPVAP